MISIELEIEGGGKYCGECRFLVNYEDEAPFCIIFENSEGEPELEQDIALSPLRHEECVESEIK